MRNSAIKDLGDKVAVYDDFDSFIDHGMDDKVMKIDDDNEE